MLVGVVEVVVDTHDDGDVLVLGRGRDDDLLGTTVDVRLGLLRVGEEAGRLDDDVGADAGPVDLGGVALLEDADGLAVHDDRGLVVGDLTGETAQDRVVLEQVGEGLVVHEVVRGHDLDVGSGRHDGAEEVAADAAKAVDTNANGHCCAPLR